MKVGLSAATVALVGPRAAGKSTVGPLLADALGFGFVDADIELAARAGQPAGAFLEKVGEPAFRKLEVEVSTPLLQLPSTVVALGGGAVLSAELVRRLLGETVYTALLVAEVSVLTARLARSPTLRPPLSNMSPADEVAHLLAARLPLYRQVARTEIDTGRLSANEVASTLAERVRGAFAI